MAINKVIYGSNTLIDLTEDTVTADNLLSGYTAHDKSGTSITGNVQFPVTSVNSKTGAVVLDATDVGALPDTYTPPVTSVNGQTGAVTIDGDKWNGVSLANQIVQNTGDTTYVVSLGNSSSLGATASKYPVTRVPAAHYIPKYDANACLISTTPSANDNSTKVATTAYVDAAIGGITVPTKTSDLTNDSGFITSYTDEKVKAIALPTTPSTYYLVLGSNSGIAETKNYSDKLTFEYSSSQVVLKVGDTTSNQKGRIYLYGSSAAGVTYLDTAATVSRVITFPDNNGTIALTSDIPQVYSSTNTGGYLTMATLPIYDGTVE